MPAFSSNSDNHLPVKWFSLPNPPVSCEGDFTCIGSCDLLFVPDTSTDEYAVWGIYKYDLNLNEWTKFIKYPQNFHICCHRVSFNKINNKLYLFGTAEKSFIKYQFVIIDVKSKHFEIFKLEGQYSRYCSLQNVNNCIHLIGGISNSTHLRWDHGSFNDETINRSNYHNLASSVYVPSIKTILQFGGHICGTAVDDVYRYPLRTNKWTTLPNISLTMMQTAVALSCNQRYVLIAGGWDYNYNDSDKIYLLDMKDGNFELKQSKVRLPNAGKCRIVRTGGMKDEYLVIGWIKDVFSLSTFIEMQLPPIYIMLMISNWYGVETLHWFKSVGKNECTMHCTIPVRHVLRAI